MRTLVAAHEPSEPKRATEWPLADAVATVFGRATRPVTTRARDTRYRWLAVNPNSKTEIFN